MNLRVWDQGFSDPSRCFQAWEPLFPWSKMRKVKGPSWLHFGSLAQECDISSARQGHVKDGSATVSLNHTIQTGKASPLHQMETIHFWRRILLTRQKCFEGDRLRTPELCLSFLTWNSPEQGIWWLNLSFLTCEVDGTVPALLDGWYFILLKELTYSNVQSDFNRHWETSLE